MTEWWWYGCVGPGYEPPAEPGGDGSPPDPPGGPPGFAPGGGTYAPPCPALMYGNPDDVISLL